MNIAHNTTITLEFRGRISYATWHMNGFPLPPGPLYQIKQDPITRELLAILTIDGNETFGIIDVSCTVGTQTVYAERLTIEGL